MRLSLSLKLMLTPKSNSSLIPSKSPLFVEYISLTSGSIGLSTSSVPSATAAAVVSCLSGTIDNCFPNMNLTVAFISIVTNLCLACGENFLEMEFEIYDFFFFFFIHLKFSQETNKDYLYIWFVILLI